MQEIDATEYYFSIFSKSIIFNTNIVSSIEKGLYDRIIYDETFLGTFPTVFYTLLNERVLETPEIENGLRIVSYLVNHRKQFLEDDDQKEFRLAVNAFIVNCNHYEGPNNCEYYVYQIIHHFDSFFSVVKNDDYEECKSLIKEMYGNAIGLLDYHLSWTSEEDFKELVSSTENGTIYILFLKHILLSKPELLNDKIFKERVTMMLEKIKTLENASKKEDKFIKKQIKKCQMMIS